MSFATQLRYKAPRNLQVELQLPSCQCPKVCLKVLKKLTKKRETTYLATSRHAVNPESTMAATPVDERSKQTFNANLCVAFKVVRDGGGK